MIIILGNCWLRLKLYFSAYLPVAGGTGAFSAAHTDAGGDSRVPEEGSPWRLPEPPPSLAHPFLQQK